LRRRFLPGERSRSLSIRCAGRRADRAGGGEGNRGAAPDDHPGKARCSDRFRRQPLGYGFDSRSAPCSTYLTTVTSETAMRQPPEIMVSSAVIILFTFSSSSMMVIMIGSSLESVRVL